MGRKSKREGKEQFNLWITPEEKRQAAVLAAMTGKSLTDFIEGVLAEYLAVNASNQVQTFAENLDAPAGDKRIDQPPFRKRQPVTATAKIKKVA